MVKFANEAFGAKLLEAITAGLYDGNLNCLREYVQNSIDSKARKVEIYFENNQTDLVIKDDGRGMNSEELEKALQIGKSDKPDTAIGWRGIGIWSGVPACRRIVIITKKRNCSKFRVEINSDKLREQYALNIPAVKVLTDSTGDIEQLELGGDESVQNSQFTIVRLEEILLTQRTIFTEDEIEKYLSKTIPAPFDTTKFTLGKEINKKLLDNEVKTEEVDVFFENRKIFRPPYSDDIFFDKIAEKRFIVNKKPVAYGWFLTSRNNQTLKPPNRGIFYKKKGVTIGDENLVTKQYDGNYNQWQYGEIHIISDTLKENASRNNFEANNDIIDPFYKEVGQFVQALQGMNQYQSQNVVTKSVEHIEKQIEVEEIKPAQAHVIKVKRKLQQQRSFPKEPALHEMKEIIDKKSSEDKTKLRNLEEKINAKIKQQPSDLAREKMERFSEFIKTSHPLLKKCLDETTRRGKMQLNIDAMNSVTELLKQKTGLSVNELAVLSQRSYDWKSVERGDSGPMLTLANKKPNSDERYRDRIFGVMIFALHHLFVDPFKHEKGKPSFAYYELMTDEEKIDTITEFYMAQNLILRLIEKSKRVQDL
jgi:hypothetical protein